MARKSSTPSTDMAAPDVLVGDDVRELLDPWLDAQQLLLESGLGQLALAQQALLKQWFGLLDDLGRQWQSPAEGAQPFALVVPDRAGAPFAGVWAAWFPALYPGAAEILTAWWSPWSAFVARGGEQLA
jgi:predicted anti-sigma-YlaC factor YlaD